MLEPNQDYNLFFKFLKDFQPSGFKEIDSNDERMFELNEFMEQYNQFLYVADMIEMKVLYTSKQSVQMLGVAPENVNPHYFMEATHPDDLHRLNLGRTKLIKMAQEIFIEKKGTRLLSSNFRIKKLKWEIFKFFDSMLFILFKISN